MRLIKWGIKKKPWKAKLMGALRMNVWVLINNTAMGYLQNGPGPRGAAVVMVDEICSTLGVLAFFPAWRKARSSYGVVGRWRLNKAKNQTLACLLESQWSYADNDSEIRVVYFLFHKHTHHKYRCTCTYRNTFANNTQHQYPFMIY